MERELLMKMEENKNSTPETEESRMALDDARRIKVLSPSMMVFKRFVRNKLAIVGFVILVVMFIFSFLGPLFSPYGIAELFTKDSYEWKNYATGRFNSDPIYLIAQGTQFPSGAKSKFLLAVSGKTGDKQLQVGDTVTFEADKTTYTVAVLDERDGKPVYSIGSARFVASALLGRINKIDPEFDTDEIREALTARASDKKSKETELTVGEYTFRVTQVAKELVFELAGEPNVLVSYDAFLALDDEYKSLVKDFAFAEKVFEASGNEEASFEYNGVTYELSETENGIEVLVDQKPVILVSDITIGSAQVGTKMSSDFLLKTVSAIRNNQKNYSFADSDGTEVDARINLVNGNYYVETAQATQLLLTADPPSKVHPLGTDIYGMDLLTRLMYGGRVSLMVGFVVVFFETIIGVIIGGVSGYFGGWTDTALMRLVDLVNAIPFYPTIIIIGSVLDHLKVGATARLFLLMVVIGILGWTGIARVVRGQILSLREQDFMIATEATGIKTVHRIFRHLVPNVMPLLIVNATMGLGGVILTEATLGFLGLGVKYPMASWGSIINQATDMHVMTNAWWIWIPAGALILITVLGFNFVGDGLRDAFDPKMKR